jgi:HSP20 family molecular chaperone IbpA
MATRPDVEGWMWVQACDLVEQTERLRRQYFRLTSRERAPLWEPPVDVFEDEHEIVVVVAMPGVAADAVQVLRDADVLVVRGARPMPLSGARHRVRQLEIPYGAFERRIALPSLPLEIGRPELVHGCLLLRLRKIGAR